MLRNTLKAINHKEKVEHHSDITKNRKFQNVQKDIKILNSEAATSPRATLKKLQEYETSTEYSLHVTSFHILHMSGLWGYGG